MSIAEAVGIALGGGSLFVALTAFLWERSQRRQEIALLRRQIAGEFGAKVVALGVGSSFSGDSGPVTRLAATLCTKDKAEVQLRPDGSVLWELDRGSVRPTGGAT